MYKRQIISSVLGSILFLVVVATVADDYPAALATDLPQYPDSIVQQAVDLEGSLLVFLSCGDSAPAEVYAFYRDKAIDQGWAIDSETADEEHRMFSAAKGGRPVGGHRGTERRDHGEHHPARPLITPRGTGLSHPAIS